VAVWKPPGAGPQSLKALYHWVWTQLKSVGIFIGDEAGGGDPGHFHDHDNLLNVTPDQHHPQLHNLTSHTDVETTVIPGLAEGHGLFWDSDTGQWRNRAALEESMPTGLTDGGELNIVAGEVEVIAGLALVVDSYTDPLNPPLLSGIEWATQQEPITAAPAVAGSIVWISMAQTATPSVPPERGGVQIFEGLLKQYAQSPSPTLAKQEIFLGVVLHNGVEWKDVSNPKVINQTAETLRELVTAVLPLTHIIQGGTVSEQAAFTLNQEAGTVWENNRNWHVDKSDPNREALPAATPIVFQYVNRDFTDVGTPKSTVDAGNWDNAGTVEAVPGPANTATIQRIYLDPANNYWILWGQYTYPNFLTAQANLYSDTPEVPFLLQNSILLGFIIVEKAKLDWDQNEAVFVAPGSSAGAGAQRYYAR
jgi:hypothetical protein